MTWKATCYDGTKISGDDVSYHHIDRSKIASFSIGRFKTSTPPQAYRRRVVVSQGTGKVEVCHVMKMKDDIVFHFENGLIERKTEFDPNSVWYRPIEPLPGES